MFPVDGYYWVVDRLSNVCGDFFLVPRPESDLQTNPFNFKQIFVESNQKISPYISQFFCWCGVRVCSHSMSVNFFSIVCFVSKKHFYLIKFLFGSGNRYHLSNAQSLMMRVILCNYLFLSILSNIIWYLKAYKSHSAPPMSQIHNIAQGAL